MAGNEDLATPDQQQDDPGVVLVLNSEDSAPFDLEPMYISLGLPPSAFRPEVGGHPDA